MSETQKSLSEHQELTQEAQQHLVNLEALVRFREFHPEIFEAIAPKVKAILTEGKNPIIPVLSEEEIKEQIFTKPRKNKYGLVMDPLEQELENIKLGFLEIEMYQGIRYTHPEYGKENPKEFFERVYNRFWSIPENNEYKGFIYQDDLMIIDKSLWIALRNHFDRKESGAMRNFLPAITSKTFLLKSKLNAMSSKDISRSAQEILRV